MLADPDFALAAVLSPGNKVFLARHGETEANRQQRISGRQDTPLSSKGMEQARSLCAVLADVTLTGIYTSSLQRTVTTASFIAAAHRLPIQQVPEFDEIGLGSLEGRHLDGTDPEAEHALKQWEQNKRGHWVPGGELYEAFVARVSMGLRRVLADIRGPVLIVGHRNTNEAIVQALLGVNWQKDTASELNIKNKFLYEFSRIDGATHIATVRLGGTRHGTRYQGWQQ
jgi:broad specificity phosphatase PhoE